MARKRKKRPRYRGKEIPAGISKVKGENGSVYFYASEGNKKNYAGKGDEGFDNAQMMRLRYQMQKERDRKYKTGQRDEARKIDREIAGRMTFEQLCDWYMNLATIKRQKSYERKAYNVDHLLRHFGKRPVTDIEPDVQEEYRSHRLAEGAAEGTINFEIGTLSAIYHLAVKRRKIPKDILPGEFVMAKNASAPRRIVSDEEYKKLLELAEPHLRDFLICAYETGMRSAEICELTADQVHLDEVYSEVPPVVVDYIHLGIFDTKTKAERWIPASPELKEVLLRRLNDLGPEGHVFWDLDRKGIKQALYHNRVSSKFKTLCARASIPYGDKLVDKKGNRIGVVIHSFRHTRITKWIELGFSDEIIRRATGHRSLESYRKYAKPGLPAMMRLVNGHKKSAKKPIKSVQTTKTNRA